MEFMVDIIKNNICFQSDNYLSNIVVFLKPIEIIKLSHCNRKLKELLDPINNLLINQIFLYLMLQNFELEQTNNYYNFFNKKNFSGKNIKFDTNFKEDYKQLKDDFNKCKDEVIKKRIQDFFKIHIYLPDLRKDNFTLDFESSSIHELFSYDNNLRTIHTYNFYSKYININNLIIHPEKNIKIRILRENLKFEEGLINFIELFEEYKYNSEISKFVQDYFFNYEYERLYNIQEKVHTPISKNKILNDIISFVLWINHIFILYIKFNYEYVHGLFNNLEKEEIINEFISKKNDLINCALLINNAFENVNIVLNFLSIYKNIYDNYIKRNINSSLSLSNCSSTDSESNIPKPEEFNNNNYLDMIISPKDKFSLYNLFFKSIDHYYTQKLREIKEVFFSFSKDYFKELFTIDPQENNNKPMIEDKIDDDDEDMKDEIISEDYDDDDMSLDITPTKKELIESFMNSAVDSYIDNYNANGINHTCMRIDYSYINLYEDEFVKTFEDQITKSINKDNIPLDICYDKVEKLTSNEGNSKNLYLNRDSFTLIRRTKKKLMKKGILVVFKELVNQLSNDFSGRIKNNTNSLFLNASEKLKSIKYICNLDALTEKGEKKVTKSVEDECTKAEQYLIGRFNLSNDKYHLAKEYIECNQIDYVFLFKKLVWNYYKQLEIYKERDERIEFYFKEKNKNDNTEENKDNIDKKNKNKYSAIRYDEAKNENEKEKKISLWLEIKNPDHVIMSK